MDKILRVLVDQWIYDIDVLSTPWVIYTVFPAVLYISFMLIKWAVLTCPVWLPFAIVVNLVKSE